MHALLTCVGKYIINNQALVGGFGENGPGSLALPK